MKKYQVGALLLAPLNLYSGKRPDPEYKEEYLIGTFLSVSKGIAVVAWVHDGDLWQIEYKISSYTTFFDDCLENGKEARK